MPILNDLRNQLLSSSAPHRIFCVAYSGGLDSHVLLHSMVQLREQFPEISLRAIHVHHGLNPQANDWVNHCRQICRELKINFHCEYLSGSPSPGYSVEAWARESRYAVLAQNLAEQELLLTAHTQDDQAETVLLQLLRGAGPKGLSAMPQQQNLGKGFLSRPLLNFSRLQLQEYAVQQRLVWLEDSSNSDLRFDRNFLRHKILPVLRERWPSASPNIARSAAHCAAAARGLSTLARQDLGEYAEAKTLPLAVLKVLSPERQRNVLREWLVQLGCRLPQSLHIDRIQKELLQGSIDRQPQLSWGNWTIRRYHQELMVTSARPIPSFSQQIPWNLASKLCLPNSLGMLTAEKQRGGLSLAIDTSRLSVGFRQGGERCRLAGKAHTTTLKKLFQEWRIPPWQRNQIPLLFHDNDLAAIIGYSACHPFAADPQAPGWHITFIPTEG